jgi:hypothetical protein
MSPTLDSDASPSSYCNTLDPLYGLPGNVPGPTLADTQYLILVVTGFRRFLAIITPSQVLSADQELGGSLRMTAIVDGPTNALWSAV